MIDARRILLRPLANALVKPVLQRYLRRTRTFRGHGLVLQVPPGVFHPGFFFSSRVMARWLATRPDVGQPLQDRTLVDVGTGSGLLGLVAAQLGANVTLLDLSPRALLAAQDNARRNGLRVRLAHSDGLRGLPAGARFDWIIANPPWFPAAPPSESGLAWYAGAHLGWFRDFYNQLEARLSSDGQALMILGDSADLDAIEALATEAGWRLDTVHRERVWWEWQTILRVVRP